MTSNFRIQPIGEAIRDLGRTGTTHRNAKDATRKALRHALPSTHGQGSIRVLVFVGDAYLGSEWLRY